MFLNKGFYGGVHPQANKEKTSNLGIIEGPLPKKVVIPLLQHVGSMCEPAVKVGDEVFTGTKIGTSSNFISSPVHSSVSGKVSQIEEMPHPVVGRCLCVVIDSDGSDKKDSAVGVGTENDYSKLKKEDILKIIHDSGIVGLGGAMFPSHVKLMPPADKPIDTLILNGAECEPYITCDQALMGERAKEIVEALKIIIKLLDVKEAFVAIESNKPHAIRAIKNSVKNLPNVKLAALKVKYPQGAERQLIKAILNREVPPGKLPLDVGVVVQNIQTAFSIYEALSRSKPLYERVVTFSGGALKKPANVRVRIGTPIKEIAEFLGGLLCEPARVVFGGPMMGIAQFTMDVPVIKGTSAVLFLTDKEVFSGSYGPCIRCGRCIEACPVKIMPANIGLAVESSRHDIALNFYPLDCIECGACSYICPTKRPLLHFIKLAKLKARQIV